jgi:hypothetical protein
VFELDASGQRWPTVPNVVTPRTSALALAA